MQTKVKKNIGHDRMTFKATFPNGDVLNFNISRSSDRWSMSQLPTVKQLTQDEFNQVVKLGAMAPDGNHMKRYDTMEALCLKAGSVSELLTLGA
jgi:hypothetical protein